MTAELDQLAFRFFKLFAQLEYALKAMGYGRATRNDAAEPDWDRFANEFGSTLLADQSPEVAEAICYMLENPPRRQVWVNGSIGWDEVANNERSAQILFSHVRRVRNNLFHGGKFNGQWIEPDRSEELLSKSLVLLKRLVDLNNALHEAIDGSAFK